jgi:hypothetical protein
MYSKRDILRKTALLINERPDFVIDALNASGSTYNGSSKLELVESTINALHTNRAFQKNLSLLIGYNDLKVLNNVKKIKPEIWYKANGKSDKQLLKDSGETMVKATMGGQSSIPVPIVGAVIGAVIGAVDVTFQWLGSGKNKKIAKENDRNELINEVFSNEEEPENTDKKKWIPIAIVSGVLLTGGIVAYFTLLRK